MKRYILLTIKKGRFCRWFKRPSDIAFRYGDDLISFTES